MLGYVGPGGSRRQLSTMTVSWAATCRGWRPRSLTRRVSCPGRGSSTWAADQAVSPGSWAPASAPKASRRSTRRRSSRRRAASATRAPTFAIEQLPWDDGHFDATGCSLVIGFMRDPDQGVREMVRVTRPLGTVAACMWDIAGGGMTMLRIFWTAAHQVDGTVEGERRMAGTTRGDIAQRFKRAGLENVVDGVLVAHAEYRGFEDFWEPFTLAVGPAGHYLRSLPADQQARVREACRASIPQGPFSLDARAWYARGAVPSGAAPRGRSRPHASAIDRRPGSKS